MTQTYNHEVPGQPAIPPIPVHEVHGHVSARQFRRLVGEPDALVRRIVDLDRIDLALTTGTDRDASSESHTYFPAEDEELANLGISSSDQYTYAKPHSPRRGQELSMFPGDAVLVYAKDALTPLPSYNREHWGRYRFDPALPLRGLQAVIVRREEAHTKSRGSKIAGILGLGRRRA